MAMTPEEASRLNDKFVAMVKADKTNNPPKEPVIPGKLNWTSHYGSNPSRLADKLRNNRGGK